MLNILHYNAKIQKEGIKFNEWFSYSRQILHDSVFSILETYLFCFCCVFCSMTSQFRIFLRTANVIAIDERIFNISINKSNVWPLLYFNTCNIYINVNNYNHSCAKLKLYIHVFICYTLFVMPFCTIISSPGFRYIRILRYFSVNEYVSR